MKLLNLLLLLLALLYVADVRVARAQDEDDEMDEDELEAEDVEDDEEDDVDTNTVHPLTNMEGDSPDVLTTYILPTLGDDLRVPVGEEVPIILGFINDMKTDSDGGGMKVKAITGSLNSARNPAVYIQNFTVLAFNPVEIVDAGAEMSFEYLFKVDSGVDLQPSQLALTVFYEGLDEDGAPVDFTSTFFNETVMLHEDNKSFLLVDVIGTYAITLGFFAACGYFLYNYLTKQLKSAGYVSSKKARPAAAKSGSSSLADDAEWTEGMNTYIAPKNKKTKKKRN
mmetsp:Transcript_25615/g.60505  ORF Transcript_25615/g.60505 Transcript_25615/m.60505 type:complete len:282 (-) Transcript_25615:226-1071(-)